jgi:ketosteroid isomerase-like protein
MSVTAKNANEQTVLDFFAALSTGDLEKLRPFLTEESVWEPMVRDIPGAGVYRGNQIIDDFLGPVRGMFAPGDPKVHVKALMSDGDTVTVESSSTGHLADGKRVYDNRYAWVFRIKDGKVARLHEYMDSHYVERLFGMDAQ